MLVMVPIVFVINGVVKGDWLEALMFALSVAVGLTPEMLPMIVTTNLAKGAVTMSRHKMIVKRLNAIQNFGAMDVLCTDKTGTLTQNKIILERHLDVDGDDRRRVLEMAWLNSHHQTGLKNLLDVAVLEYAQAHKGRADKRPSTIARSMKSRSISCVGACRWSCARDRRRTPACVQGRGRGDAVDLGLCRRCADGAASPWTPSMRTKLVGARQGAERGRAARDRWSRPASSHLAEPRRPIRFSDETGLTLHGYVAFLDPPKESARAGDRRRCVPMGSRSKS